MSYCCERERTNLSGEKTKKTLTKDACRGPIPGDATLLFSVKLLHVKKAGGA